MGDQHHYEQLIIGAGFAGIGMAIKLKEANCHDFIIVERDSHLGGTWYVNDYPGAACDVQSHLYSYSFEQNPNWSRTFGSQKEILQYIDHCAKKYKITPHFRFGTNVTGAAFNCESGIWTIKTSTGDYTCKYLISCSGGLSQPALPAFKGMDSFKGEKFHSAKWNHQVDLKGKTVAVIGTGASAIQIVPSISTEVKQLHLYQRTPPWILPKPDRPMRNWEKKLFRNVPAAMHFYRELLYWKNELFATGFVKNPAMMSLAKWVATKHIRNNIKQEALRHKVTPTYTVGCKRVLLSNNYYPALNRENVEVVTEGITQITETGVQSNDGKLREADVLIFATGFYAAEGVVVYDIKGRDGIDLNEAWKNGAEAYLGTSISRFPNLFLIVGPNTGLGHSSMLIMIEAQIHYIIEALKNASTQKAKYLDVKEEVQKNYNEELQNQLKRTVWQTGGCISWYQDKNGKNVTLWPGYTFTFRKRTKKFEPEKYEMVK